MKYLPLLLLFFGYQPLTAQTDDYAEIDSLFLDWNIPNHPGGAIGIAQGGKIVYAKAFGLASLEYLVPNSPGMRFNTGSVSKQFTALGIVKLHLAGKLDIEADIRDYLPELPDFGDTIRIYHLLHHTSGLRSLHAMLELAGWRADDGRTNADLDRFLLRQKELNFRPGAEYLYCNTGYMLMVNLIERVTGEKFVGWMRENIFLPLGMPDSYVEDQYNRVVANNATSYDPDQARGFDRAVEYWGYVGSGNMHSTVKDLLHYLTNYYSPQPGWEAAFAAMQTVRPLNNGRPNNYAYGVILDEEINGAYRIQHGGSIGGFRAHVSVFPKEELQIVVLTNFANSAPGTKAEKIAKILLPPVTAVSMNVGLRSGAPNPATTQTPPQRAEAEPVSYRAEDYTGTFYSPELETTYVISASEGKLIAHHSRHGDFALTAKESDFFTAPWPFNEARFERDAAGEVKEIYVSNGRVRNLRFIKSE